MGSGVPSGPEAITAALDRFDAAQGQIAALPFDILTGPEALTVKNRLETISRRQAAVDHRLTRQLTCQGSPIELGGKSWTDVLCTRLRIGRTATRRRCSCCTQTTGRQSNSRCCRRRLSNSKVCRSMRSAERFGALPLRLRMRGQQIAWSETSNADDWSKNLIRMRCEGRYATSISSRWVSSNLT
jgi:hypothetical protein